ncbi:MAG TPA: type II secretion system protein GspM [Egibacteraceae bacterium]|nr:type II secretion system protein GspM [Egibacteraceae bacterium]
MRFSPPIVGLLVAVIVTVAFWFFLWRPAADEQALIEAETATLQQQANSLEAQIASLRDIEARQVEINAARARLVEFIPEGPAQPSAIRQFQRAADAAGADIASVTFGPPTVPQPADGATPADTGVEGTTLADIAVTMSVEGGYFQVVDFFRRLEVEVPRAVLVESVAIGASEAGFPRLSAEWSGRLFAVVDAGDLVDTTQGGAAPAGDTGAQPQATETPAPEGGEQ